jgi:hypothetical protein
MGRLQRTIGARMVKKLEERDLQVQDQHAITLRLSAQRALLGNIPANLRSASIEYRGTEIACRFIFYAAPSDDDKELLSCAAAEIISDFPDFYTVSEEYLAIPSPLKITHLGHIVFLRHED